MNLKTVLLQQGENEQLSEIVLVIAEQCKTIAEHLRMGDLGGAFGNHQTENVQGEMQKKMDVIANDLLKSALLKLTQVAAIASEEEDSSVSVRNAGDFVVAFDPLDGSSNIDINAQTGTIFTIYPTDKQYAANDEKQFLQAGRQQVSAGYVLYGSSCVLMINWGESTRAFTLDARTQEFILTTAVLQCPEKTQEFSINASNQYYWFEPIKNYIRDLILGKNGARQKHFNMRWNGAMVGDLHRVLLRGGIFLYPEDKKNPQQPAKLRLLYEANPMAKLIEGAGGLSWSGDRHDKELKSILAIQPQSLHQRVGVIMGSADEVRCCFSYFKD